MNKQKMYSDRYIKTRTAITISPTNQVNTYAGVYDNYKIKQVNIKA
jgi:hypothetical protein